MARATLVSGAMTFSELLRQEFERRRAGNRRYSLRAFAKSIGTDHSTLSQILRGRRRLTARTITRLGARIGMTAAAIAEGCASAADAAVLATIGRKTFRPDSRWIATMAGIAVDDVNVSLQRLLYNRALTMVTPSEWRME